MKAAELHAHLSGYLAQNPLNGAADIALRYPGSDFVFGLAGANDARGMGGEHLLIFIPNENATLQVREASVA